MMTTVMSNGRMAASTSKHETRAANEKCCLLLCPDMEYSFFAPGGLRARSREREHQPSVRIRSLLALVDGILCFWSIDIGVINNNVAGDDPLAQTAGLTLEGFDGIVYGSATDVCWLL